VYFFFQFNSSVKEGDHERSKIVMSGSETQSKGQSEKWDFIYIWQVSQVQILLLRGIHEDTVLGTLNAVGCQALGLP
jgi:hypothetical protein